MSKQQSSKHIFFVDPQSMINLAKYDYYLLEGVDLPVTYFCSKYYDFEINPRLTYKHVFRYNHLATNSQKAISYVISWIQILAYAVSKRPKVVHIQWFRIPRLDLLMVRLLQRVVGAKVVFTAHNVLPHQGNEIKATDVFSKAYAAFDRVIVHSQVTKDELVSTFRIDAGKVEVIRHGILPIDNAKDSYSQTEHDYDTKYAALKGKTVFAALGYQNHYKGTDLLATVWASTPALRDSRDTMLVIIGKVNDKSMDLSMLAQCDNVICDNRRIPDEEFLYLLRHTSVYVLPYRDISQSGAMLTAIAEHIPLLVTDVGSLAEPLSIAPVGWKMQKASEQELQEALLYLASHKEIIRAIHDDSASWAKVCKFYDWAAISHQTQQLYERVMGDNCS